MIDQRLLRTDLDGAKAALSRRGDPNLLEDLDHAARLDVRLRDIQAERDEIRAKVNSVSKDVGMLRRDGNVEEPKTNAFLGSNPFSTAVMTSSRVEKGDPRRT